MSYIPTQETITVGGKVFTDLENLIQLHGILVSGGSCTLRKADSSSGYLPSGSNNFQVHAIQLFIAACGEFVLLYSDNDMGVDTSTAPTNPVYPGGSLSCGILTLNGQYAAGSIVSMLSNFIIPNGKYIAINYAGYPSDGVIRVYGYEIAP